MMSWCGSGVLPLGKFRIFILNSVHFPAILFEANTVQSRSVKIWMDWSPSDNKSV